MKQEIDFGRGVFSESFGPCLRWQEVNLIILTRSDHHSPFWTGTSPVLFPSISHPSCSWESSCLRWQAVNLIILTRSDHHVSFEREVISLRRRSPHLQRKTPFHTSHKLIDLYKWIKGFTKRNLLLNLIVFSNLHFAIYKTTPTKSDRKNF